MTLSQQQRSAAPGGAKQYHERTFQRVGVNLPGRLMLASHDEFNCIAVEMSPGDVVLTSEARPRIGERVIAYIEYVGRIEGHVLQLADGTFVIDILATDRKREKLAAQLTWIANKHELGLPEDRRHDRLSPRRTTTELVAEDGARHSCRLIDLSLSGAAIDTEIRFPIGTAVTLGSMKGRVVRLFQEGMAIEFIGIQSRETLREFL